MNDRSRQPPAAEAGLRAPRQRRSRASRDRILDATEALLAKLHFDQLRVDEVARSSRVSIGSFYNLFPDKDSLMVALFDRYRAELDGTLSEADIARVSRHDLATRVRWLVLDRVAAHRRRLGLRRALVLHARRHPDALGSDDRAALARAHRRLESLLLARPEEIRHPHPELAVSFAMFTLSSLCRERILFAEAPHARALGTSDRALVRELSAMLLGYLGAPTLTPLSQGNQARTRAPRIPPASAPREAPRRDARGDPSTR